MQISDKYKPCKKCGCRGCNHYSRYKQIMIRWGNRKFRQLGRLELRRAVLYQEWDNLILGQVGIGYTD